MKLLFLNTNVPSNVGNGFFYFGIQHVLSEVSAEIALVSAPFPPQTPFRLDKQMFARSFDLPGAVEGVDGIVVAGPVLDMSFDRQFGTLLRAFRNRGKRIYLLSVGGRRYDAKEHRVVSKCLAEVSPDMIVTRDRETYDLYGETAKSSLDGICFAFFVSDAYAKYQVNLSEQFCVATLDFDRERRLSNYIEVGNGVPRLRKPYPKTGTRSFASKCRMVLQSSFDAHLNELEIIRPTHRPIRHRRTIFHKRNAFCDFDHLSYLHLYANTQFTITDRLHAAVATMAFGKPAYLPLVSKRTRLLESAGCQSALKQFFVPDMQKLTDKKNKQRQWLADHL